MINSNVVKFDDLQDADLVIDRIYKGGTAPNQAADPLHILMPGCENAGGFRKKLRKKENKTCKKNIENNVENKQQNKHVENLKKYAYIVLYTSMTELEWPDELDKTTGIFKYYGDNRKAGRGLLDTEKKGNQILEDVFSLLDDDENRKYIPPFFVFKKANTGGRDVQFLGIAAPGTKNLSPDKDLVAFWRTYKDNRFQNYEAYFTILDTGTKAISKAWIKSLIEPFDESAVSPPEAWKKFVEKGRTKIQPLQAPAMDKNTPEKDNQLPDKKDRNGIACLNAIVSRYNKKNKFSQGFEPCAIDIVSKMDKNFVSFKLTRPYKDGGRDALGIYAIRTYKSKNLPLTIECALEAKCHDLDKGVGVKEMSRLISRIKNREFGIMVTTSYVAQQAYEEVVEDGHPILIVTGRDIVNVLKRNSINSSNIDKWLDSIDKGNPYNKSKSKVKP